MSNERRLSAFNAVSKAEYEVGYAIDNLKAAQDINKDEMMNKCIQNILRAQEKEGKLVERDLLIFISDLVRKVSDIKSR